MQQHVPAPITVRIFQYPTDRLLARVEARVDGRALGESLAFPVDHHPRRAQLWARAFLSAVAIAPMVAGVRA